MELRELYKEQIDVSSLMRRTARVIRKRNIEEGAARGTFFDTEVQTGVLIGIYREKPELYTIFPMGGVFSIQATALGSGQDLILTELRQNYLGPDRPTIKDAMLGGYELLKKSTRDLGVGGPAQISVVTKDKILDYSSDFQKITESTETRIVEFLENQGNVLSGQS